MGATAAAGAGAAAGLAVGLTGAAPSALCALAPNFTSPIVNGFGEIEL